MSSTIGDKIRSGVPALDERWGGLYRGGAYVVYGRVSSGRGHVGLRIVSTGVGAGERALLVSEERLANLIIQGRECGLDLETAFRSGLATLIRPHEITGNGTSRVEGVLGGLASVILDRRPDRVVLDDLLSVFAGADEDDFVRGARRVLDAASALGAVIVMLVPEPSFSTARRLIELLLSLSTASIHVQSRRDEVGLELLPRIGHVTRTGSAGWRIDEAAPRTRMETVLRPSGGRDTVTTPMDPGDEPVTTERAEGTSEAPPGTVGPVAVTPVGVQPHPENGPLPDREAGTALDVDQLFEEVLDEIIAEGGAHVGSEPKSKSSAGASAPSSAATGEAAGQPAETASESADDPAAPDAPASPDAPAARGSADPEAAPAGAPAPEAEVNPRAEPAHGDPEMIEDRDRFEDRLTEAFQTDGAERDFVLVGMRLDDVGDPDPDASLSLLTEVATGALGRQDVLFADAERARLIALLRDARTHDATAFFERVKRGIRTRTGNGDRMLNAVSAVIADRGRPFNDAGSFLSYVLDSE